MADQSAVSITNLQIRDALIMTCLAHPLSHQLFSLISLLAGLLKILTFPDSFLRKIVLEFALVFNLSDLKINLIYLSR